MPRILVTTLKDGTTVTAKQSGQDLRPITYSSAKQASQAVLKLTGKGVTCHVERRGAWRSTFYVAPTAGYEAAEKRPPAVLQTGAGGVHVQVWTGTNTARVTDMSFADKAGKRCAVLTFRGWWENGPTDDPVRLDALQTTLDILRWLEEAGRETPFNLVRDRLSEIVEAAAGRGLRVRLAGDESVPTHYHLALYDEEIKAIDAPKPLLTAGVEGQWSASADETGIHVRDLMSVNEWTEITHGQTNARAYAIAKAVWPQVQTAKTRHEASAILRAAGAKLHGYCAMD
jgi:hypothetical protein